jgi:hypothetical protein
MFKMAKERIEKKKGRKDREKQFTSAQVRRT